MAARIGLRGLRTALLVGIVVALAAPSIAYLHVFAGAPAAVILPDGTYLPPRRGATWVSYDPVQCSDEPPERAWHESNNATPYPPEFEAQRAIIVGYYSGLGISVFDARRSRDSITCAACSCWEGHTVYVQVADGGVDDMVALGFRSVP